MPESTIISLVPKDPNPCQKHFCTPKGTLLPDSLLLGCRTPKSEGTPRDNPPSSKQSQSMCALAKNHNATQPHAPDLQPNHVGDLDSIQVALDLRNSAAGGHGLQRQSTRSRRPSCHYGGRAQAKPSLTSRNATMMEPAITKPAFTVAQRSREKERRPVSVNLSISGQKEA